MAEKKEAVERLLALGADPNAPNTAEPPAREGGAAEESRPIPAVLVMAASMGLEGICRALLEAGADPAACDSDGCGAPTPRNVSSTCRECTVGTWVGATVGRGGGERGSVQ